ncbi:MAG: TlpA disulfide reductase family protein [Pirellulales bacterium]
MFVPVWGPQKLVGQELVPSRSVLHLAGGDHLAGQLMPSDSLNVLRWQGQAFTQPFDFSLGKVHSIHFPLTEERGPSLTTPEGDFAFEFFGGDLLYGNLVGMTPEQVVVEMPKFGNLQVHRKYLRRMVRWMKPGDLIYRGPHQLADWQQTPDELNWREEAGHLITEKPGAMLQGNLFLPEKARIELELSWKKQGSFLLGLGEIDDVIRADATKAKQSFAQAFRLEVWDDQLVVVRENDSQADIAVVTKLKRGAGRIHLILFLDLLQRRLRIVSATGQALAEVHLASGQATPTGLLQQNGTSTQTIGPKGEFARAAEVDRKLSGERLCLLNRGDHLRLERLQVSRWNGFFPKEGSAQQDQVELQNGTSLMNVVEHFDLASRELVLGKGSEPRHVPLDEVASVFFHQAIEPPTQPVFVSLHDGSRLHGELLKVSGNHLRADQLWMVSPVLSEPMAWPIDRLGAILVQPSNRTSAAITRKGGRMGRLESFNTKIHGRLVTTPPRVSLEPSAVNAEPSAHGLHWQPRGSLTASPLKQSVVARIVYRDPPVPKHKGTNRLARPNPVPPGVWGSVMKALSDQGLEPSPVPTDRMLYLRAGDSIPCEVTHIDSEGVHFQTSLSESQFVPHEQVKAIVLTKTKREVNLSVTKRQRLLTLPRMHRESPPTHLICSIRGDYLRGRLIGMDGQSLQMEVRLENVVLPKEHISHIIWFHEDELKDDSIAEKELISQEKSTSEISPVGLLRTQAVRTNGVRITFNSQQLLVWEPSAVNAELNSQKLQAHEQPAGPTKTDAWRPATTLLGYSRLLGSCRVELKNIDRLLLGGAIEQEAAQLAPQGWKLRHAQQPRIASIKSGDRIPGTAAALVGNQAPNFQLDLLDGETFHLQDCAGQIVVLDFWASWCGPCIQAMPQIDQLIRDLPEDRVRLVAVNLQESPKQINAVLERLQLETVVALDVDGIVAEKYTATAIPQTVVIDRDGNIARLFVGGGPQSLEHLREALEGLLEEE